MTDIRIDRPGTKTQTQTKKYYKSKYCFSLHLPKELEDDNVKIKFTKMDRLFFTNLDRII